MVEFMESKVTLTRWQGNCDTILFNFSNILAPKVTDFMNVQT